MAASVQISPELLRALAHPGNNLDAQIAGALAGVVFAGKALACRDGAKPYVLSQQEIEQQQAPANDDLAIQRARVAAELLRKDEVVQTQAQEAERAPKKGILDVVAEGGVSPFVTARSALKNNENQQQPENGVVEEARGVDDGKLVRKAVLKTDLGAVASLDESHEMVASLPTPGRGAPDRTLSI